MPSVVVQSTGFMKIKKQYKKEWKAAALAALEEAGGSMFLKICESSITCQDMDGNTVIKNGDGVVHEISYDEVAADKVPPTIVQVFLQQLDVIKGVKPPETQYQKGSTHRTSKFMLYTQEGIAEAFKSSISVGGKDVRLGSAIKL